MDKPPNKNLSGKLQLTGRKAGVLLIVVIAILIAGGAYFSNIGYSVYVNGIPVGIVKNRALVKEVVAELTQEIEKEYSSEDIVIGADLEVKKVKLSEAKPLDRDTLKKSIMKTINVKRPGVALMIDGKPIVFLQNRKEAEALLEDIKNTFGAEKEGTEIEKIYIKEKVELVEDLVEVKDLMSREDAYRYLLKGTTEEKVYTVKKGDSLWLISKNNNISVEDLQKANPEIDPKKLQIGQKINLLVPKPFITVVSEERITYKKKIPYQTEYRKSDEYYKGESIVRVYGKYGIKKVTARIVKENGVQVSKEILEEKVIKQPVNRLVVVGTKPPPPREGTGTFSYPARGQTLLDLAGGGGEGTMVLI